MRVLMAMVWVSTAVLVPVANALAAEQVIIEARAARYTAGAILDAAAPIVLAAGEFVLLATDDGRLLRVDGPHDGPVAGAPGADEDTVRRALARLVTTEGPEVGGVGGVRGDAAAALDTRPEPWLVDAAQAGDQCVRRDGVAQLWLEGANDGTSVEITDAATDVTALARWDGASGRSAWPEQLGPQDGQIYLVRDVAQVRSVAIRVHALPSGVGASGLAAAAWLAAKGCTAQARLLLR